MSPWLRICLPMKKTQGDSSLIPGSGRSPGGGNGNSLQCSYLENPMDRGAWRTMVHGVTKELEMTEGWSTNAVLYYLFRSYSPYNWKFLPFTDLSCFFQTPGPWKLLFYIPISINLTLLKKKKKKKKPFSCKLYRVIFVFVYLAYFT